MRSKVPFFEDPHSDVLLGDITDCGFVYWATVPKQKHVSDLQPRNERPHKPREFVDIAREPVRAMKVSKAQQCVSATECHSMRLVSGGFKRSG
jgi:hypothetical protein